jgi:hypothetical protein
VARQAPRAVAAAVLVAGLAAGCGHASGTSTHPGPSSHAGYVAIAHRVYVACTEVFCTMRAQMKTLPTEILTSADGSFYVNGIIWRRWGTGIATGTGTTHANNCKPNCAQGTYHEYPGTIMLTDPNPWRGDMAYTRETVSVPAIHYRFTLRTGLVPGSRTPPPLVVTQPPTPGPVSTGDDTQHAME